MGDSEREGRLPHYWIFEKNDVFASLLIFALIHFLAAAPDVVRSYLGYYTGSHQNSAVKRRWARIVLEWVTSREVLVSHPTHSFRPTR